MGFFRNMSLLRHAQKIAAGFSLLRSQQFDSVLRAIEKRVTIWPGTVIERRTLGGDADLTLKAFQLVVATTFHVEHTYVPDADFQRFSGLLTMAVSGTDTDRVLQIYEELGERQRKVLREGTDEAIAELFTQVSIPIADYILSEPNPVAWVITAH